MNQLSVTCYYNNQGCPHVHILSKKKFTQVHFKYSYINKFLYINSYINKMRLAYLMNPSPRSLLFRAMLLWHLLQITSLLNNPHLHIHFTVFRLPSKVIGLRLFLSNALDSLDILVFLPLLRGLTWQMILCALKFLEANFNLPQVN